LSKKRPDFPSIRSRTLIYVHEIPVARIKKFWDGIAEGKLYATRCKVCGELYYPPQGDCARCLNSDVEWVELSREGVLEAFACSYLKPQGFEHFGTPYIIAIARVPEDVKVMGILEDIDCRDVRVGMRVKIEPRVNSDGFPIISFKPVKEAAGYER